MKMPLISALRCISLTLLVGTLLGLAQGRALDSEDLAIGSWKVALTCKPSYFRNELFPSRSRPFLGSNHDSENTTPRVTALNSARTFACRLNIFSNGTFLLQPEEQECVDMIASEKTPRHRKPPPSLLNSHAIATNESDLDVYPVRGHWDIQKNPYCATDRSFDEITFRSYPRVQKLISTLSDHNDIDGHNHNERTTKILRRVQVSLSCRMSGHFSSNRIGTMLGWRKTNHRAPPFARGRLSHGVILDQQDGIHHHDDPSSSHTSRCPNKESQRRRRVSGSFAAQRVIPSMGSLSSQQEDDDDWYDHS